MMQKKLGTIQLEFLSRPLPLGVANTNVSILHTPIICSISVLKDIWHDNKIASKSHVYMKKLELPWDNF